MNRSSQQLESSVSPGAGVSRRDFLATAASAASIAGAAAAPTVIPASALGRSGRPAPSERIVMGLIGAGARGTRDMQSLLRQPEVQFVAVADPAKKHYRDREWGRGTAYGQIPSKQRIEKYYANQSNSGSYRGCETYGDFRHILERDDIDAVVVGTPDHWHAIPVIRAAATGKDIYGEKPLSLTVAEGRRMVEAVERHDRVFQTGSQQRSDARFRFACELARNGRLGRIHTVEVGLPTGKTLDHTRVEKVPDGLDYEMWLGPAPQAPYAFDRVHRNFRWVFDYSGGQVTDWGAHHCDIAQWGLGTMHTGPVEVEGKGEFPDEGWWNTAVHYRFVCTYADGTRMIVSDKFRRGVRFIGEEGSVYVRRGAIEANPPGLLRETFGPGETHLYRSDHHHRNFVECVKSRAEPVAPIENAHRTITIAHIGNIAMRLGRKLRWDPAREQFKGDETANRMLDRADRETWAM